ncbi:MAG: class I SAM-dependent methyltransferase [Candidatus Sacchiramonaceae bacterium]|nr:class I SAM-dependent methyltransferase [Candidatus Saccharimonadaceae bacterium]
MISVILYAVGFLLFASFGLIVFRGAPFVPSRRKYIQEGFGSLTKDIDVKNTTFFDIGSGNGVVLEQAAKFGFKKSIGYELNPILAAFSKFKLKKYIKQHKVEIKTRDFLLAELPQGIGIFYCFGYGKFVEKTAAKLQRYANFEGREVYFMSMAFELVEQKPVKSNGLYHLYKIAPCKKS